MPWCEQCVRFYTPSTLTPTGQCPSGHHVADPAEAAALVQSSVPGRDETESEPERERVKAPWHCWVLAGALVLYLGWRFVQGISWLF